MRKIHFVFLIGILIAFGCKNDSEEFDSAASIESSQKSAEINKTVKIDITVDVTKLLQVQPGGGEITDQSIISMNQKGGFFDPATQNTAKLITQAEIGTKIKWKIKSGTTSDNLDLGDYVPEDNKMLSVFIAKPGKVADDEIDGDIIATRPTQNFKTQYTLSFHLKKNPGTIWTWDPIVIFPLPPV